MGAVVGFLDLIEGRLAMVVFARADDQCSSITLKSSTEMYPTRFK